MIDILVPVLNRPHRVLPLLESIAASTTVPHTVLFVTSPHDDDEVAAIVAAGARHLPVPWAPAGGDYAKKINYGFARTWNDYVFLGADDLSFQPQWDVAAFHAIESAQVGVCGTQDNGNPQVKRGLHSTHSLVRRAYIDECGGTWDGEPGVVYFEGYHHQWVDAELVAVAKERGCWTFAQDSRVIHHHPFWDKTIDIDATYTKALDGGSARHDADLFRARQRQYA